MNDNITLTAKRGDRFTDKGTMPKDKLARFKLTGNTQYKDACSHNRQRVARSVRFTHTYRLFVHGVNEPHLPASLRNMVHYFMVPHARDTDFQKDRRDNSASVMDTATTDPLPV